jgi:hypothetical protein
MNCFIIFKIVGKRKEKKKKYIGLFIVAGCWFWINAVLLPAGITNRGRRLVSNLSIRQHRRCFRMQVARRCDGNPK